MPPRFRRPRPLSLLAAASLAVLNCDDARPEVPLASKVAEAFCAHQFACCSPFEISTVTSDRYKTQADCVAFATLAARQQLGPIEGAIAQGRISVDAARADACVAAYRDRPCNLSMQSPEVISPVPNVADVLAFCPDLLVGHVPGDRACNFPQECLQGSRCAAGTPPAVNSANPGICVPYQKVGERCNQTSDCDDKHFACRQPEFVCGVQGQEGEPCTVEYDMITGAITSNCDASRRLFCDNSFSSVCRRYPRDGEPCNFLGAPQCDPDAALALSCNPQTGTCQRPGQEGDPCGGQGIPPCRDDLACHPMQRGIGVCEAVPVLGQACFDRCASPAVCVSGVCTLAGAAPLGAPCQVNADCASLSCTGFNSTMGTPICAQSYNAAPRCIGAGITPGNIEGTGGTGGTTGIGGTFGTAGTFGTGTAGKGIPPTGAAGSTGAIGCQVSDVAPGDPIIADFSTDAGGMLVLPIGGTFTYEAPSGSPPPVATVTNGALHVTLTAPGTAAPQYLGVGIYFNGNPFGTDCIDATAHTGVQFDISGSIGGAGCSAQYSTNDSAHSNSITDPKGSGNSTSYAPQAPLTVVATSTTVMMPFAGPGAPTGGSPSVSIDRAKLTGVQWQFTVASGTGNSCAVDITIDNVKFF